MVLLIGKKIFSKEFQTIGYEQSVYLCHEQLEIGPEKIVDSG